MENYSSFRRVGFLLLTLFLLSNASAQNEKRYLVYLTDKNNSSYSIEKPQEYLGSRALERRKKQQSYI